MTTSDCVLPAPVSLELLQDALVAANINPRTGLATDYLNHFNEMVMLLRLYPDSPDLREEILGWEPRSYAEHFHQTGFRDKALALDAYHAAPRALVKMLDVLVAEMDTVLLEAQGTVAAGPDGCDTGAVLAECADMVGILLNRAGALMNGHLDASDAAFEPDDAQAAIDSLFEGR